MASFCELICGLELLGEDFLFALLFFFARDAERSYGAGFEAIDRKRFFALFTESKAAVFDFSEGPINFLQELCLALLQAQAQRKIQLRDGKITFVALSIGGTNHSLTFQNVGLIVQELRALSQQNAFKALKFDSRHLWFLAGEISWAL